MTDAKSGSSDARRGPRVFRADDPDLVVSAAEPDIAAPLADPGPADAEPAARVTTGAMLETGFRWGAVLASALLGAALLSAGLWFARFVSVGIERDDWLGQTVRALVGVAAVAGLVLLLRELIGWRQLARLGRLRRSVDAVLASKDIRAERKTADRILSLYAARPDLRWPLDRMQAHRGDVLDAGGMLTLLDREVMTPLDTHARRQITTSARRVATVTALAPLMSIAFAFVVFENLRLLRQLASTYGGRPGFAGSVRLGRAVVGNLIAAGGVAMTDDLLGQFIGQDVLRRLSRRLGEGAFNGALTARIGVAAISAVRPMPFLVATPLRARDILGEVIRAPKGAKSE
jgi:putative membrane protein